eukprot:Rmarinus@m.4044
MVNEDDEPSATFVTEDDDSDDEPKTTERVNLELQEQVKFLIRKQAEIYQAFKAEQKQKEQISETMNTIIVNNATELRKLKENHSAQLSVLRVQHEEELQAMRDTIETAKEEAKVEADKEANEKYQKVIEETKDNCNQMLNEMREELQIQMEVFRREMEEREVATLSAHRQALAEGKSKMESALRALETDFRNKMALQKKTYEERMRRMEKEHIIKVRNIENQAKRTVERIKKESEEAQRKVKELADRKAITAERLATVATRECANARKTIADMAAKERLRKKLVEEVVKERLELQKDIRLLRRKHRVQGKELEKAENAAAAEGSKLEELVSEMKAETHKTTIAQSALETLEKSKQVQSEKISKLLEDLKYAAESLDAVKTENTQLKQAAEASRLIAEAKSVELNLARNLGKEWLEDHYRKDAEQKVRFMQEELEKERKRRNRDRKVARSAIEEGISEAHASGMEEAEILLRREFVQREEKIKERASASCTELLEQQNEAHKRQLSLLQDLLKNEKTRLKEQYERKLARALARARRQAAHVSAVAAIDSVDKCLSSSSSEEDREERDMVPSLEVVVSEWSRTGGGEGYSVRATSQSSGSGEVTVNSTVACASDRNNKQGYSSSGSKRPQSAPPLKSVAKQEQPKPFIDPTAQGPLTSTSYDDLPPRKPQDQILRPSQSAPPSPLPADTSQLPSQAHPIEEPQRSPASMSQKIVSQSEPSSPYRSEGLLGSSEPLGGQTQSPPLQLLPQPKSPSPSRLQLQPQSPLQTHSHPHPLTEPTQRHLTRAGSARPTPQSEPPSPMSSLAQFDTPQGAHAKPQSYSVPTSPPRTPSVPASTDAIVFQKPANTSISGDAVSSGGPLLGVASSKHTTGRPNVHAHIQQHLDSAPSSVGKEVAAENAAVQMESSSCTLIADAVLGGTMETDQPPKTVEGDLGARGCSGMGQEWERHGAAFQHVSEVGHEDMGQNTSEGTAVEAVKREPQGNQTLVVAGEVGSANPVLGEGHLPVMVVNKTHFGHSSSPTNSSSIEPPRGQASTPSEAPVETSTATPVSKKAPRLCVSALDVDVGRMRPAERTPSPKPMRVAGFLSPGRRVPCPNIDLHDFERAEYIALHGSGSKPSIWSSPRNLAVASELPLSSPSGVYSVSVRNSSRGSGAKGAHVPHHTPHGTHRTGKHHSQLTRLANRPSSAPTHQASRNAASAAPPHNSQLSWGNAHSAHATRAGVGAALPGTASRVRATSPACFPSRLSSPDRFSSPDDERSLRHDSPTERTGTDCHPSSQCHRNHSSSPPPHRHPSPDHRDCYRPSSSVHSRPQTAVAVSNRRVSGDVTRSRPRPSSAQAREPPHWMGSLPPEKRVPILAMKQRIVEEKRAAQEEKRRRLAAEAGDAHHLTRRTYQPDVKRGHGRDSVRRDSNPRPQSAQSYHASGDERSEWLYANSIYTKQPPRTSGGRQLEKRELETSTTNSLSSGGAPGFVAKKPLGMRPKSAGKDLLLVGTPSSRLKF